MAHLVRNKHKRRSYLSFSISLLLIILLLSAVDFTQIFTALLRVDIFFYALGFLVYTASYFLRALRFRIVFPPSKLSQSFLIVAGHMLLNQIFPLRSGELSLLFFLKHMTNISYSQSIPYFILLRLFDLVALIVTFLLVILWGGFSLNLQILMFIILALCLCIICISNVEKIFLKVITLSTYILPRKYTSKIQEFGGYLCQTSPLSNPKYLQLFFLSLFDRICNYAVTIFLIKGMSFEISYLQLIIANAVASLSNVLPINSIGSFGTLELGWAGALILYDVPREIAISSGFSFHLLFITYTMSLGLTSLLIIKIKYNIIPFVPQKTH